MGYQYSGGTSVFYIFGFVSETDLRQLLGMVDANLSPYFASHCTEHAC